MREDSPDPASAARLAQTLVGLMFDEPPVFVTGRVPDGWPPSLLPPTPASTLGGMSAGISMTAVFLYPAAADGFADYRSLVEANGWRPQRGELGGGFDSSRGAMLCRDSTLAQLRFVKSDPDGAVIMVTVSHCDGWPCGARPRAPDFGTITVPRLAAPPGVRWDSGGGGSGAGDHVNRHIRVTTDLAPAELLPLYARQLADAGWTTGAVQATPANAIQWLEATDERGRVWRGLLAVYANESACEVFIYMATLRTKHTPNLDSQFPLGR